MAAAEVTGAVVGVRKSAVVFPVKTNREGELIICVVLSGLCCNAISLGNPFISTYHWLHVKFWGQCLVTAGLQFCFLWICNREEDDQILYTVLTWLKCLQYLLVNLDFIFLLAVAEILSTVLGHWMFSVVVYIEVEHIEGLSNVGYYYSTGILPWLRLYILK